MPTEAISRAAWIDRFVMRLSAHQVDATPAQIDALADEMHETSGHLDPIEVADAEYLEWPPHDD